MNTVSTRPFVNPRARHDFGLRSCSIVAAGSCLPERVVATAELGRKLGKDSDWILTRTGIRERRIAAKSELTSDLAAQAAQRALHHANLSGADVDLVIVATNTPDMLFPATACLVQSKIGARRCAAFDLKAAGAGFLYALEIGQQFVATRCCETVLVIGAEKLSSVVDPQNCDTSILFGDGAGAVLLQHRDGSAGLLTSCLGSDGDKANLLTMPAGGSRLPASRNSVADGLHYLQMNGPEMFKQAVQAMHRAAQEALHQSGLTVSQIRCIIPHQSNQRITDAFADKLGAAPEQVFSNIEKRGNTSAASIPIALDEAVQAGRIARGDLVLLVGFGGGLTWGATVLEW